MEIVTCNQGSDAWFEARKGLPTSSQFKAILAKGEGKTRKAYLHRLAAEIVSGTVIRTYHSDDMERGNLMEAEARDFYAFTTDAEITQVGFVKNEIAGCSPDSLVGTDGLLEIKTQRPDLLVNTLLTKTLPAEHKPQIMGNLWVTKRKWLDLLVFWPTMPHLLIRVERDEGYINNLAREVSIFSEELHELVARLRREK